MSKLNVALSAVALVSAGLTGSATAKSLSDTDAVRLSYSALQARAAQYGIQSARNELRVRQVMHDELNESHVRLDQYYRGLPVFGMQLVTHLDEKGRLFAVSGEFSPVGDLSVRPTLSPGRAIDIAMADFRHGVSQYPQVDLVVLTYEQVEPVLAYKIELRDIESDEPAAWTYFINAHNGNIMLDWDSLETAPATGTAMTQYSGTVQITTESTATGFSMTDNTRGGAYTTNMNGSTSGNGQVYTSATNTWGDGSENDPATQGADAHYGVQMTFDFYKNVMGRNGIKDNGQGAFSRTHYGHNYVNAFWDDSCFCMTYGDGDGITSDALVTLDVAGHEMSHGVTSNSAGLVYTGQAGGLNESVSDCFGTSVEYYAIAHGAGSTGEYWIGEDCWTPAIPRDALRYMDDPTRDGISIDNATKYRPGLDVHYSSGVQNNVFYLASEGGTNKTSGQSVTGIGRDKVEQILYRALTKYYTPTTNFKKAKQAWQQAAMDLYGQSASDAVGKAWSACGVN